MCRNLEALSLLQMIKDNILKTPLDIKLWIKRVALDGSEYYINLCIL